MTGREAGFLLLCSPLGDPLRKTVTPAQLRFLGKAVQNSRPSDPDRELSQEDLLALGCGPELAERVYGLLQQEEILEYYLRRAEKKGIAVFSQVSCGYPEPILEKLGLESPGSLWCKGDLSILAGKKIALVGSRDLQAENAAFSREVGYQAAVQGYTLVSGNARGADQEAQNACLEAGGQVISVVADSLLDKPLRRNLLYVSEDGYDLPFSAQRALSRNRLIHSWAQKTFVAQCGYQVGGTWSGTVKNLRFSWSPVYCFADESPAHKLLCDMGAQEVCAEQLTDLGALPSSFGGLF